MDNYDRVRDRARSTTRSEMEVIQQKLKKSHINQKADDIVKMFFDEDNKIKKKNKNHKKSRKKTEQGLEKIYTFSDEIKAKDSRYDFTHIIQHFMKNKNFLHLLSGSFCKHS